MQGSPGPKTHIREPLPAAAGHELRLEDIVHRFGSFVAADRVSLTIRPGELIALLGPSGCGKTTLLRIIAGFLTQTEGDVLVDGRSISGLPTNKRNIGIVFQNYALFPHMTVAENVAYGPKAAGAERSLVETRVSDMLDLVQMRSFADRMPRQLSGGQQQRIALARCLATEPSILLLDEPFGALDKNLRLDMQIEIKRLQKQSGITTILVTHDQEEALGMADRIAVLRKGVVEQYATPTEIYDHPATLFVNSFVGTTNLIPATMTDRRGSDCGLLLGDGTVLRCTADTTCGAGDSVFFSIRPEMLSLTAAAEPGAIPATVRAVMPLGPATVFDTALADGTSVKVTRERTQEAAPVSPGSDVGLVPRSPAAGAVFPNP